MPNKIQRALSYVPPNEVDEDTEMVIENIRLKRRPIWNDQGQLVGFEGGPYFPEAPIDRTELTLMVRTGRMARLIGPLEVLTPPTPELGKDYVYPWFGPLMEDAFGTNSKRIMVNLFRNLDNKQARNYALRFRELDRAYQEAPTQEAKQNIVNETRKMTITGIAQGTEKEKGDYRLPTGTHNLFRRILMERREIPYEETEGEKKMRESKARYEAAIKDIERGKKSEKQINAEIRQMLIEESKKEPKNLGQGGYRLTSVQEEGSLNDGFEKNTPMEYQNDILEASVKYNVPTSVLSSVLAHESMNWNPDVLSGRLNSPAGAIGPGQLMPETAKELGVDPYNTRENILGSAKYLKQQFDRFGTWDLALAAYNAGPGNVQSYGGIPPFKETQNYVSDINRRRQEVKKPLVQKQPIIQRQPQQGQSVFERLFGGSKTTQVRASDKAPAPPRSSGSGSRTPTSTISTRGFSTGLRTPTPVPTPPSSRTTTPVYKQAGGGGGGGSWTASPPKKTSTPNIIQRAIQTTKNFVSNATRFVRSLFKR